MFSTSPAGLNHVLWRCFSRLIPVVLLLLVLTTTAADAQSEQELPSSVVLVLKLISATHAEPTTGIVVSETGLVLVPEDFVSGSGEIIVLDGGADIVKHGRPATIVNRFTPGKLAVLSVDGLARNAITLSKNVLNIESELYLTAFPPAEYIARGAPPIRVPVKISADSSEGRLTVSASNPLPYVSGPILDACGYLSGVSLTRGPQSMQKDKLAEILLGDDLKPALEALQVRIPSANCISQAPGNLATSDSVDDGEATHEASGAIQGPSGNEEPDLIKPEVYKPFIPRKRLNPFQGTIQPSEPANSSRPSLWQSIPLWLQLLGFVLLAVLCWKGVMFWRLHRNGFATPASGAAVSPSASDNAREPETGPTAAIAAGKPRSIPMEGAEFPDMDALPDGCNGLFIIDGLIDTDMRFQRFCAVDTEEIEITVGRNDADININHPVISRSHARFENRGKLMTLSDLGSASGTFISGVPCLRGDVMVVEAGDEIFFGDIQIRFSILHKDAGSS